MRKSLNLLAAAALLAALCACNRQPAGLTPDDERDLNNAAAMNNDNMVVDTSPDDQSVNVEDVEENAPEAAPADVGGNRTANRQ